MTEINVRELRNHGGEVLDRVARGESLTVTRSGRPVAQLRPLPQAGVSGATLLARWKRLPKVDPTALRADLDATLDAAL